MNAETAKILCKLNNDFYQNHYVSFSATRKSAWTGWERCLDEVKDVVGARLVDEQVDGGKRTGGQTVGQQVDGGQVVDEQTVGGQSSSATESRNLSVFDLACGNLRFAAFLEAALPATRLSFYAVDNCDALACQDKPAFSKLALNYQNLDIMGLLQAGLCLNEHFVAPVCDLSVSFGFLHHVPLLAYRQEVLSSLVAQTRQGGYVIISLWQFLNNKALGEKARREHEAALTELNLRHLTFELDENDYLLGWKNLSQAWRYCHSFSDAEIDSLIEFLGEKVAVVARFVSDGRSENLNTYLILKVL
ncbi:MAG: class I SAM-dependent methyltransferase [Coriobacteriaceae bacterium]|jgi:SAM-dependent methyltransferase|nr:class I SAM-dependent methyltransferase [Coriobacteriaceae bacterium]